jgi:uncharacterized membrane protein
MSEARLRRVIGGLSVLGLGIAGYLTVVHYSGGDPACLAGGGGCHTVQESDYAKLVGVPVPLIGLIGYLVVLASALLAGDRGRMLGLFATLIGFGFSLYLTYLELFVIEAICQWCVASAVVMTAAFGFALWRALRYIGTDEPSAGAAPAVG